MFYYLSLAAALFAIGLFGILSHKSARGKIISLFVLVNAIVICPAAFEEFIKINGADGQIFLITVSIITALYLVLCALGWYLAFIRNQAAGGDSSKLF